MGDMGTGTPSEKRRERSGVPASGEEPPGTPLAFTKIFTDELIWIAHSRRHPDTAPEPDGSEAAEEGPAAVAGEPPPAEAVQLGQAKLSEADCIGEPPPGGAEQDGQTVGQAEAGAEYRRAHQMELLGLALSGGGIRSATFNLGLLQALAEIGLLRRIDYLSTVSGGGYIGSWLTAWTRNSKQSIEGLAGCLAGGGCDEIEHLREYSNYLTPRRGAWSADTWSAVATYVRNALLNLTTLLLVVVTVLVAVMSLPVLVGKGIDWLSARSLLEAGSVYRFSLVALVLLAGALMTHELQHAVTPEVPKGRWKLALTTRMLLAVMLLAALLASPLVWELRRIPPSPLSQLWSWALGGFLLSPLLWCVSALLSWLTRSGGGRRLVPLLLWSPPAGVVAGASLLMAGWLLGWLARMLAGLEAAGWDQAGAEHTAWLHAMGLSTTGIRTAGTSGVVTVESFAPWLWIAVGPVLVLLCCYLTSAVHTGLVGRSLADLQREWWSRLNALLLRGGSLWLLVTTIAFAGPACFLLLWMPAKVLITSGWLGSTVAGVLLGRSVPGPAGKLGGKARDLLLAVAPVFFFVGLLLFASLPAYLLLIDSLTVPGGLAASLSELGEVAWGRCLAVLGSLGGVALLLSWRVDVNEFSMNLLYRHRLVRAFLGASRRRKADALTDFDPGDDLPLAPDDGLPSRPFHLINTTLNLASRQRLAWQQRKAASFIFSPLYCGYELAASIAAAGTESDRPVHAYQPAWDWGTSTGFRSAGTSPLTLGAAMAISGAAVSPSMGYRTRPLLAALLTVFNVRLGWWVGNPRGTAWLERGPIFGISLLVRELFGLTTDRNDWVYLSDGGHFENLGLYELVRRRCRFIIAADAGMDKDLLFEDLGNAIRKCRTDLGIDIEIDTSGLRRNEHGYAAQHHVVGLIRYDRLEDEHATPGLLIYLKASLTGDEPADIRNYAAQHPLFPHEPTTDQWFDEAQFESYRRLGLECGRKALSRAVAQAHCLAGTRPGSDSLPSSELIFVALSETSLQPTHADQKIAIELGNRLSRLYRRLHRQSKLAFLVPQVFPELRHLLRVIAGDPDAGSAQESGGPETGAAMALPSDGEALRAGFAFSLELIQLMKDIFYGLDLVNKHQHPNNRGWINLFRHLTWPSIVRLTWAATASTLTPAFQRFGEQYLGLTSGDVQLHHRIRIGGSPGSALAKTDLNFFEKTIVSEVRSTIRRGTVRLYRFHLVLADRIGATQVSFPFGLAITLEHRGVGEAIVYLRVQDHLRLMGLARRALRALLRDDPDLASDMTVISSGVRLSEPIGESDLRSFDRLFDSVRREQGQRG